MEIRLLLSIALILSGIGPSSAQISQDKPKASPFSCVISAENKSVKSGSSAVIDVAMTNTSNKPAFISTEGPTQGTLGDTVDVRQEDGGAVARRGPEHKLDADAKKQRAETFGIIVEYKPGITGRWKVNLTDWYDLTRPGKYSVQANCDEGVKSNLISVTVSPQSNS